MTDGSSTTASGSLDNDERAELLRLREEVATLRKHTSGTTADVPSQPVPRRPRHGLRWVGVTILLVLVAVLAIASVTARFTRSQILDTDRYVSTVAPLGDDPALQAEISNQITDEIFTRVDVEGLTEDALTALTDVSNLATNAPASTGPSSVSHPSSPVRQRPSSTTPSALSCSPSSSKTSGSRRIGLRTTRSSQ